MTKSTIESTLKSTDTEEWFDILFYRPIGYRLALWAHKLKITPNQITIASILLGVTSGYLFFYSDIYYNLFGMLILVMANSLDSADGQLARMTHQTSALGRWLDGAAGDFWFISIYFFLCLRMTFEGYSLWIWVFAAATGYCHTKQAALADYYRTLHLMFIKNKSENEFQRSEIIRAKYQAKSWRKDFFSKFALMTYVNYNVGQEQLTPNLQQFYNLLRNRYGDNLPQNLRDQFRIESRPLMKYTNILTFNCRAFVLFFALFVNIPWLYFAFEITVLNVIFVYMRKKHEQICNKFYQNLFHNLS